MNEEKRTQWVKKDPELNAWWRSTGMRSMREFTRKHAKELDVKIKEKALAKAVHQSKVIVPEPEPTDAEVISPETAANIEKLADELERKIG